MNAFYELYIRFMVWLGATPPIEYEHHFSNQSSVGIKFEEDTVTYPRKSKINPIFIGFLLILCLTITLMWLGHSGLAPDWTGLGEKNRIVDSTIEYEPAKSLWDWLELLIIPAVLFGVGFWFNSTVRNSERKTERDRLQENALQNYFDQMTELLLDKSLRGAELENDARDIARVRTLTILERLDKFRKGIVLRFLYEAQLIDANKPVISLTEANLRETHMCRGFLMGANLSFTNLENANLSETNLHGVDFHGVTLYKANLQKANLEKASLELANLRKSNLNEANLRGSHPVAADLSLGQFVQANLQEAGLIRTNLRGANLKSADLSGAKLYETDLEGADLQGANLQGCKFYRANLKNADLRNADLRRADLNQTLNLNQASLEGVRFNGETRWPEGFSPVAKVKKNETDAASDKL